MPPIFKVVHVVMAAIFELVAETMPPIFNAVPGVPGVMPAICKVMPGAIPPMVKPGLVLLVCV